MTDLDMSSSLDLVFASGEPRFRNVVAAYAGRIMGVFAYAAEESELPSWDVPCAWVPLPVWGEDILYEIWVSSQSVTLKQDARIRVAVAGDLLFGTMVLDDPDDDAFEAWVYAVYSYLFDKLNREGCSHLLRVWNYFSRINDDLSGIERYRAFNIGRHQAFIHNSQIVGEGVVPAACTLGSQQGNMVVSFLAGKTPGTVIENPRQTNAYYYPPEFGPRSPTFSRGILVGDTLLISGTASIVGSRSMHPNDVRLQLDETIRNLETVFVQAQLQGFDPGDRSGLCLNVYLRHAADYPAVRKRVDEAFSGARHVAYIIADVCRADLLVEIEAFWMPRRQ
jgi:chorismate lyase / 3-hydroxybenzoate synthase